MKAVRLTSPLSLTRGLFKGGGGGCILFYLSLSPKRQLWQGVRASPQYPFHPRGRDGSFRGGAETGRKRNLKGEPSKKKTWLGSVAGTPPFAASAWTRKHVFLSDIKIAMVCNASVVS